MTAAECLTRATEMDAHANSCTGNYHAKFVLLAKHWRDVAAMAGWQDDWTKHNELSK